MTQAEIETEVARIVDVESEVGIRWWPGEKMAPIALRRWRSYARRQRGRSANLDDRIVDLAKGLQSHFGPDAPSTPFSEFLHLSRLLAVVLEAETV